MVSAIFKPEVSALESQVATLQAQLAALEQRITLLNETEAVAGGSLEALKGAIQKVSSLAPDAIATLKSAVLDLFRGDSNDDFGFDNQPISPAPKPGFDNRTLHELALDACREYALEQAIAPQPEALNGQSCEFASPLACQLEDAPSAALTGQSVEIACLKVSDAPKEPDYIELVPLNHLVAYQRKTSTNEIICYYVGGNNKSRLKDWGSWLCTQHSVGSGFEVRKAERLTAYNHELKIWGMSLSQIQRLAETDTTKRPPSRYHVASQPVAERLLAPSYVENAPEEIEQVASVTDCDVEEILATEVKLELAAELDPQVFGVGDKVEVTSDRHGVELLGQTGIVTAGTTAGAAVNVGGTQRLFCSDEVVLVEASAPRNAVDDLFSVAPAPAYNANPQGRGGTVANWKARQASGIGVNLRDCGTGGITSLEEWGRIEAEQKALAASTANDEPDF